MTLILLTTALKCHNEISKKKWQAWKKVTLSKTKKYWQFKKKLNK